MPIEETKVLCSQKEADLPIVHQKSGNTPPRLSEINMKHSLSFNQIGNANVWVKKTKTNRSSDTLLQFVLVFFDSDVS